ncbi:MAG: hypothetical protein ABH885_01725, partial [Candidatus Omnitrophota bacterium]
MNRFLRSYIPVFLVITACGLYFRFYPVTVVPKKQFMTLARMKLYSDIRNTVAHKVDTIYPDMPARDKRTLINKEFYAFVGREAGKIEAMAENAANNNYRQFSKSYLLGADSYFYYYLTENIVKNGAISKKIESGRYFDPFMLAPSGSWRGMELHPYAGAVVYWAMHFIFKHITLMQAVSLVPILLF